MVSSVKADILLDYLCLVRYQGGIRLTVDVVALFADKLARSESCSVVTFRGERRYSRSGSAIGGDRPGEERVRRLRFDDVSGYIFEVTNERKIERQHL